MFDDKKKAQDSLALTGSWMASISMLAFSTPLLKLEYLTQPSLYLLQFLHSSRSQKPFKPVSPEMKLIIAGANGFVGTELVRQSLRLPSITSIIALSRRPVDTRLGDPSVADASKLKSVVVRSYDTYSDDERAAFANADACIW